MKRVLNAVAAIAAVCAIAFVWVGCDKPSEPVADEAAAEPAAEVAEAVAEPAGEPGGIKVTVSFDGAAPKAKPLNRTADPYCAKTKKKDPSVMVKGGKLQNVVVKIASKVKGAKADIPAGPVSIKQSECMYEPRVSVGVAGQQIAISNSDSTLHNVHAYKGDNKENWFNNAQPPKAPDVKKKLPKGMVQFKCDVHPWMSAFVSTAKHPFNSVTGADGLVSWNGVPSKAKPYKVETWHEVYGKQQVEVIVEAGKVAEVTVTYKAGQAAN